jgi:hypothetical protein
VRAVNIRYAVSPSASLRPIFASYARQAAARSTLSSRGPSDARIHAVPAVPKM